MVGKGAAPAPAGAAHMRRQQNRGGAVLPASTQRRRPLPLATGRRSTIACTALVQSPHPPPFPAGLPPTCQSLAPRLRAASSSATSICSRIGSSSRTTKGMVTKSVASAMPRDGRVGRWWGWRRRMRSQRQRARARARVAHPGRQRRLESQTWQSAAQTSPCGRRGAQTSCLRAGAGRRQVRTSAAGAAVLRACSGSGSGSGSSPRGRGGDAPVTTGEMEKGRSSKLMANTCGHRGGGMGGRLRREQWRSQSQARQPGSLAALSVCGQLQQHGSMLGTATAAPVPAAPTTAAAAAAMQLLHCCALASPGQPWPALAGALPFRGTHCGPRRAQLLRQTQC